jgi:Mg2+/citrate symporter
MNNILLDLFTFTSVIRDIYMLSIYNNIFSCLVFIIIYSNVKTDKSKIIKDNKNLVFIVGLIY